MSTRPRSERALAINTLIEQILASKGLDKKLKQYRAWTIWDEVVGPQIARHAQPLRIRESILEVRVENPTWMQQLQLLKPKILKELNHRLGDAALSDIFWKRGKIERDIPENIPSPRLPTLSQIQIDEIDEMTRSIHDAELKQKLKSLLVRASRQDLAEKQNQTT